MTSGKLTLDQELKKKLSEDLKNNPQIYAYTVWDTGSLEILAFQGHTSTVAAYEHKRQLVEDEGWERESVLIVRFTELDEL